MAVEWNRVEDLYFRALALNAEERPRFIGAECGADAELRTEVLALLSADARAAPFLERPALEAAAERASAGSTLIGRTVGRYRIVALAGVGAMGTVYRAEDAKLNRAVALKALPSAMASDISLRHRLRAEASTIARLSHPHICRLYDVEQAGDIDYLVMEFVEGETLATVLSRGPLPAADAVRYAQQMAGALAAAHRIGIIHRDVKPTNVMIADAGAVLMDFGVAKTIGLVADTDAGHTGTMSGTVVGTAAYMSPEQARGEPLDGRTDVFSLGLVLYEMATGSRALKGDTVGGVFASLMSDRPAIPVEALSTLPPAVGAAIRKATEKNRERRFQSMTEFAAALDEAAAALRAGNPARRQSAFRPWMLVGAAVALVLVGVALWRTSSARPEPLHTPKTRLISRNSSELPVYGSVISPDGALIAWSDRQGMHVTRLADGASRVVGVARNLPASTEMIPVGWTAGSSNIVFNQVAGSNPSAVLASVWMIPDGGGAPTEIRQNALAGAVSPTGDSITFTTGGKGLNEELHFMALSGERSGLVAKIEGETGGIYASRWSPDGKRIAYVRMQEAVAFPWTIEIRDLDGSNLHVIANGHNDRPPFWWLADGRFVYFRGDTLWYRTLDARTGRPRDEPRQLTNSLSLAYESTSFSASADGRLLALQRFGRQYDVLVATLEPGGRRLSGPPRRLTLTDSQDVPAAWTADGRSVIFTSDRSGKSAVYVQGIDEPNAEPLVLGIGSAEPQVPRLSPDGRSIIYSLSPWKERTRIMQAPVSGGVPDVLAEGLEPDTQAMCTARPARFCMLDSFDGRVRVLRALDPATRRVREMFRLPIQPGEIINAAISPDGQHVAVDTAQISSSIIRLFSPSGALEKELDIRPWTFLWGVDFASDSKSLFVPSVSNAGVTLLHVDLNGRADPLYFIPGAKFGYAIASPDGRHIAIRGSTVDRNVIVLERP